jgi:hypothetical protein
MKKTCSIAFVLLFLMSFQTVACKNEASSKQKSVANITTATPQPNESDAEVQAKVLFSAWGLNRSSFTASATVQKGVLRLGDKIDGLNQSGVRLGLTVSYIKTAGKEGAEASAGQTALVELTTDNGSAESLGEDFFIVKKGGKIITETTPATPTTVATTSTQTVDLTANFSGKKWQGKGNDGSHLFYAKGISSMNNGKPFLMLAFKSTVAPDDRQLTFKILDFSGKTGKYQKSSIEVLFSGSADGNTKESKLFGCKSPATVTDFVLDITDWQTISVTEALISGVFSGTLKGILTDGAEKVTEGKFSKIKVKVYNDKY